VTPDTQLTPDDRLLIAYRTTRYRVSAPGRDLLLTVDRHDAELAKLLREAWTDSAALITAWNPRSRRQEDTRNRALQAQLVRELEADGHPCLPGRNEAPIGDAIDWTEDSVLALGITLEKARAVAARYGQYAFLWIDKSATPRLVLTAA
jgi:hypothetical protein